MFKSKTIAFFSVCPEIWLTATWSEDGPAGQRPPSCFGWGGWFSVDQFTFYFHVLSFMDWMDLSHFFFIHDCLLDRAIFACLLAYLLIYLFSPISFTYFFKKKNDPPSYLLIYLFIHSFTSLSSFIYLLIECFNSLFVYF